MSTRLQVVVEEAELRQFRRAAKRRGMNLSAWVRTCLRDATATDSATEPRHKIEAIRSAARNDFPTGDIDAMLADIEQGYLSER